MKLPCYIINVEKGKAELFRVLNILFSHGYVFLNFKERIKTIEHFKETVESNIYGNEEYNYVGWNFVVIPNSYDCRMIIECYIDNIDENWIVTTIEEFLEKYHVP